MLDDETDIKKCLVNEDIENLSIGKGKVDDITVTAVWISHKP